METINNVDSQNTPTRPNRKNPNQKFSWCNGSDDWGTDSLEDSHPVSFDFSSQNNNEENGNVFDEKIPNDNSPVSSTSDDEDSMGSDVARGLCNLQLNEKHGACKAEEDNRNANSGLMTDCASGGSASAFGVVNVNATGMCCAEIEGDETDAIIVESPKAYQRDLIAFMKHTSKAVGSLSKMSELTLQPFFISVYEEFDSSDGSADHVRELYQEFQRNDELASSISNLPGASGGGAVDGDGGQDQEMYEKSIPLHGDLMFYNFISTVQKNPGQLLR